MLRYIGPWAPWLAGGSTGTGEGVATYRDGLAGRAGGPRGQHPARRGWRQDRPLPARRAPGAVPGTEARDGQQNQ